MQIDVIQREFVVVGPVVNFSLHDNGKAQVMISVVVQDGTSFQYAGDGTTPPSSTFPPGKYLCACTVSAYTLGSFGRQYDSVVEVAGKIVARAQGSVPTGSDSDTDTILFEMAVS